jgi:hypothetical protein
MTDPHAHPHIPGDQHRHTADGGPVVLDVGGAFGALVLHTTAQDVGAEIEISPLTDPGHRTHVAVHPRQLAGHTIHAAVYPDLLQGDYHLWSPQGTPALTIHITGGTITEATWPQ